MSEKDTARRQRAIQTNNRKKTVYIGAALLVAVITVFFAARDWWEAYDLQRQFAAKTALIKENVGADGELADRLAVWDQKGQHQYVVFVSVCDTLGRALVRHGSGSDLDAAWASAAQETSRLITQKRYQPVWVKVDVVTSTERIQTKNLGKMTKDLYDNFFRKGVAFDDSFQVALLEAELNGNKIINYDDNVIDRDNLNDYLQTQQAGKEIKALPPELILFSCKGYFCDEQNLVYQLYDNEMDYGRRKVEAVDKALVKDLIHTSSQFLANLVQADGRFVYGYYPTYDKEIEDYNIIRHASTIWSLIAQYRTTGDPALPPKIDQTIDYLVNGYIEYPQPDTAYVIERKDNEVKLGANAVAIITMIDYMEEFHNEKYKDLIGKLGNGIVKMQDPQTGQYYHVLNYPDYSRKEEVRTVYYDGEATFALVKLYGYGGEERYLQAAQMAVEYFIAHDYTVYADHWVAYAMNEITQYVPQERYFEFALRNAQNNLDQIYDQETSYHTYLELLMVTFDLFDRIRTDDIPVRYLAVFDQKKFIATIYHRARHQLNGYLYPEYAMYLKNPARIANTFCVRHDGYRIRIDDVQHFIGGYYAYYRDYDKLETYRRQLGL